MKDIIIVINSSNRIDKLRTFNKFPKDVIDWVVAIPKDQEEQYLEVVPKGRLLLIPENIQQFLPSQRQYCTEYYLDKYKYIFFMDDDLTFFKRNKKLRLKKASTKDVLKMFKLVRKTLNDYSMVGISTRLGNNCVEEDTADTARVTRCYAFNLDTFKKVGAVFNPFEPFVAEDFHINLCFLNKGYNNRVIFKYAQEDIGSNAKGGCSLYRTPDVQKKTAYWMASNHPEVSVKVKKSANWNGFEGTRVDMVVHWKKAYKPRTKVKNRFLK